MRRDYGNREDDIFHVFVMDDSDHNNKSNILGECDRIGDYISTFFYFNYINAIIPDLC